MTRVVVIIRFQVYNTVPGQTPQDAELSGNEILPVRNRTPPRTASLISQGDAAGTIIAFRMPMLHTVPRAIRALLRAPGLSLTAVLTIALGVGAGTALFSIVKAVLLNPLPYSHPEQIAWLSEIGHGEMKIATRNFLDWREQNHSFSTLAAYGDGPVIVGGGAMPERTHAAAVTRDFFAVLGVPPLLGRTFSPAEHGDHAPLTAVLGYGLWQRAYGGDPDILGRTIRVIGMPATIIGVMPQRFAFPAGSELSVNSEAFMDNDSRTAHNDWAIGRLRPGVTVEQARQDISAIARRLKQLYPGPFQARDAATVSLQSRLTGEVRPALLALFGAAGFLLLLISVNVANLLLVRTVNRSRELAICTALGASRARLFRDLMIESLLLALAGGALGLWVALWSMDLLRIVLPANLPRLADIRIDAGVIAFALGVSALAGLLVGTLPGWLGSRLNLNTVLKAGARSHTSGRRARRIQSSLVVSEVALSLVLLAGAGLLVDSFSKLRSVDPGFRSDHVLVAKLGFSDRDPGDRRLPATYRDILESVASLPGARNASLVVDLPLDPMQPDGHFFVEGRRDLPGNADASYRVVSPGYFHTLGIPLVRGRDFTGADKAQSAGVAILGEKMARTYFPDRDPIGERIWFDSFEPREHWLTIVGIVRDVRQDGLVAPIAPAAYVCYTQASLHRLSNNVLVVRTASDPAGLASAVRARIHAAHPETAVSFDTMEAILDAALAARRFQMRVLLAFAMLALILAAIGIYGVLSYTVSSHRAEIGIRMALGARPAEMFRMVTARALRLTLTGTVLGIAGCWAVRRMIQSMVTGITPAALGPLAMAAAILLLVGLLASCLPAHRAMRVEPMAALRDE